MHLQNTEYTRNIYSFLIDSNVTHAACLSSITVGLGTGVMSREEVRILLIHSQKSYLDFWNYPDWSGGNPRDGGQPFWMLDAKEPIPEPEPLPLPPKPTHRRIIHKISGVEVVVMEPV